MSDQVATPADASTGNPLESETSSRRERWFELILLLSLGFGTSIFGSIQMLNGGRGASSAFQSTQWSLLLFHEICSLALLGYIMRRRRLRLADLGFRWSLKDLARGAGLTLVSYCVYSVGYFVVHAIHRAIFGETHTTLTTQAIFGHLGISAVPLLLLNPFFEELIVRAYLITEVRELTGSSVLAMALSVAVQTSYHLYYGWQGALALSFLFATFSVYYARTRRAAPIVVAHGAFDLWGLFLLR